MVLVLTVAKAQEELAEHLRERRLAKGLTQEGLAKRADVSLASLRKFEQKGLISLESFLKLMMVLGGVEEIVAAAAPRESSFTSIDDVLKADKDKPRKKGWRK
tara:strand:- start:554 stop:862 length:309 start_codon:yes stop_codon:yes gene_type:complete